MSRLRKDDKAAMKIAEKFLRKRRVALASQVRDKIRKRGIDPRGYVGWNLRNAGKFKKITPRYFQPAVWLWTGNNDQ